MEVQDYLSQELAELDEMERRVAECFENKNTYLKDYNPRWMEVRLKIKERKAAILGLNKNIIELEGKQRHPARNQRRSRSSEALGCDQGAATGCTRAPG